MHSCLQNDPCRQSTLTLWPRNLSEFQAPSLGEDPSYFCWQKQHWRDFDIGEVMQWSSQQRVELWHALGQELVHVRRLILAGVVRPVPGQPQHDCDPLLEIPEEELKLLCSKMPCTQLETLFMHAVYGASLGQMEQHLSAEFFHWLVDTGCGPALKDLHLSNLAAITDELLSLWCQHGLGKNLQRINLQDVRISDKAFLALANVGNCAKWRSLRLAALPCISTAALQQLAGCGCGLALQEFSQSGCRAVWGRDWCSVLLQCSPSSPTSTRDVTQLLLQRHQPPTRESPVFVTENRDSVMWTRFLPVELWHVVFSMATTREYPAYFGISREFCVLASQSLATLVLHKYPTILAGEMWFRNRRSWDASCPVNLIQHLQVTFPVTDLSLKEIFRMTSPWTKLRSLVLNDCGAITDEGLEVIAESGCCAGLKTLLLLEGENIRQSTWRGLCLLIRAGLGCSLQRGTFSAVSMWGWNAEAVQTELWEFGNLQEQGADFLAHSVDEKIMSVLRACHHGHPQEEFS